MTVFLGTGCACLYGGCGSNSRTKTMKYDGESCSTLATANRNRNVIGDGKQHRLGDGENYYVSCLWFTGKKGTTITVQVRSSDFAPDIFLTQEDEGAALAHDSGSSMATISETLPKNQRYAVLVTSIRPLETGAFTIAYEVSD